MSALDRGPGVRVSARRYASEVVERHGLFCASYSDRASHFFETPKAGGKVDTKRVTQVGRALEELGIRMIPAYSPQARWRSERNFAWQGRLPQELRLRVHRDNTVQIGNRALQIEKTPWRDTLAGCHVTSVRASRWHAQRGLRPAHRGALQR